MDKTENIEILSAWIRQRSEIVRVDKAENRVSALIRKESKQRLSEWIRQRQIDFVRVDKTENRDCPNG